MVKIRNDGPGNIQTPVSSETEAQPKLQRKKLDKAQALEVGFTRDDMPQRVQLKTQTDRPIDDARDLDFSKFRHREMGHAMDGFKSFASAAAGRPADSDTGLAEMALTSSHPQTEEGVASLQALSKTEPEVGGDVLKGIQKAAKGWKSLGFDTGAVAEAPGMINVLAALRVAGYKVDASDENAIGAAVAEALKVAGPLIQQVATDIQNASNLVNQSSMTIRR